MKIFVLSIPKSGTYLIAEMLKRLGYGETIHASTHDFMDLSRDLEELRDDPDKFRYESKFQDTLTKINFGEFAVGHIPYDETTNEALLGWTKIFTYRNMRDIVISATRYYGKIKYIRSDNRDKVKKFKSLEMGEEKILLWLELWGEEFATLVWEMVPWTKEEKVLSVKFEDIVGLNGEDKQIDVALKICYHVGKEMSISFVKNAIKQSLETKTVTSTDRFSNHKEYWTNAIEEEYIKYGFKEVQLKSWI